MFVRVQAPTPTISTPGTFGPADTREDSLLENLRFKIAPSPGVEDMVGRFLPDQAEVTVSCLSAAGGISATLRTATKLSEQGYRVIPHLPARSLPSTSFLRKWLTDLTRSGIGRIIVMAGDGVQEGPYGQSLHLMEDISELSGSSFKLGIVGYPETHPFVPDSTLYDALLAKQHMAADVTTQLCFDPRLLRAYLQRLRSDGLQLPVWAGAPCPLGRDEIIEAASRPGAGVSLRKISRPGPLSRRSFTNGKFNLTRFSVEIGPNIAGLQVNTFNRFNDLQPFLTASNLTGVTP